MRLIDADEYAKRISTIMACWNCSPYLSLSEAERATGHLKISLNELSQVPTAYTQNNVIAQIEENQE